jgi:hydrogenase expression/formation protein HypC
MCFEMPARIVTRDGAVADVEVDGTPRQVSLVVLDLEEIEVGPGDWVLVHTGFAVRRLAPDQADELLTLHRAAHATSEERP